MDKWDVPYIKGKTTKRFAYRKMGVYLIRDRNTKEILYIGMSKSNLAKTLYRHFQSWSNSWQYRVVYRDRIGYEVRVILTDEERVGYVESRLIRYFNPKDNRYKYKEGTEETIETCEELPEEFKELVEIPF